MSKIQNRITTLERNNGPRNFQPKQNQVYQKKAPQQEPRIPNQLDSTNLVEEVIPWCRPCDQFHQESTCYIANQVIEHGIPEVNNQETTSSESDHVCMVGQTCPLSNQHWQQAMDYSYEKDILSNFYGAIPSLKQSRK